MHDTLKDEGANLQQIELGIEILFELGQVVEVRALGGQRGVVSGYFDSHGELAKAIKQLSDAGEYFGVYYTLNPCHSDLLARREKNKWHCGIKETTRDKDIVGRRWLLVDFDPKRLAGLSGVSATTAETCAAKKLMVKVLKVLRRFGWPLPVVAFSGNGYHLLFRVDEPNDDETTQLFKGCLKAISEQFASAEVDIDTSVFNASRITKAYGSLAAKGVDTVERPHRHSRIKRNPANLCTVTRAQLEALVKTASSTKSTTSARTGNAVQTTPITPEKIEEFLKWAEMPVRSSGDYEGGTRWSSGAVLISDPEHNRGEVCVIQYQNGALKYHCFHQSCCENEWAEVRAAVEEAKGETFNFGTRNASASTHYRATPAGIVHQFVRNGGKVQKPLTNFTARIVANTEVDDGVETKNNLEIEAVLRIEQRCFLCRLPSSQT